MNPSLRWSAVPLFVLAALASRPAAAQNVAAAEALFNKGLEDMEAGRYKTGCAAIGESYKLDPLPGALFALADCHAQAGDVATAVARYEEYLRVFDGLPPAQQAKQRAKRRDKEAAAQRAALLSRVPQLTLTLPASAPKGTRVVQDDVELGAASLGLALPIDPGEHVVTTQAPGGPMTDTRVTIREGEKKTIELEVRLAAPAPARQPTTSLPLKPTSEPADALAAPGKSSGVSASRVLSYVAFGTGAAGVVVGLVTGGLALGKQDVIEKGCRDVTAERAECDPVGLDAAHRAQALELASTIGFAVGAVGLATGTVLLFVGPKEKASSSARRWVGAEIASTRGSGASAVVKGAW